MTVFPVLLRAAPRTAAIVLVALLAAACHDVVNSRNAGGFVIGGNVAGLVPGASVELSNGSGTGIVVAANGAFFFPALAPNGSTYDVTVFAPPTGEACVVGHGAGAVMDSAVMDVSVLCTPASYAVGGTVSGLVSGKVLVLQDDGTGATTVSADGMFVFSTGVPSGSNYAVTIRAQPDGQSCAITGGSGTVAANDVLNVVVVCSDDTYNVGVSVTGLNAPRLTLADNGGDALAVSRNGSFDFDTPVASGSDYAVTVSSQPSGEACAVTHGTGTIVDVSISNVVVTCVPTLYSVSGSLGGLHAGRSIVVQDNGGDSTTLTADGSFTFSLPVASGSGFAVTVLTPPVGQSCSVSGGSGTVMGANVTAAAVSCSDNRYDVGVSVSGLLGGGLILQDNGTDNLAVPGNGAFNFNTPLPTGSAYAVSILAQPAHQTCAVAGGSGTVVGMNIAGILITCTGEWTWDGGSSLNGQPGLYGMQGSPSPGNIPGARYEAASFTDLSGKFWLFGGYGLDQAGTGDDLNDLWTYDPAAGTWTWVGGSDTAGSLGSYGRLGTPSPANQPGARAQAGSWTDPAGNFWIFGGFGYDSVGNRAPLNDLWRFMPSSGTWTWLSGSQTVRGSGTYGTQGVGDPGNVPGARSGAVTWSDAAGHLWLFGGQGAGGLGPNPPTYNDLWRFDPATGNWTWVSGSNATNQAGVYGSRGVAAPGNRPGARSSANAWLDSLGNLWLFGGLGLDSAGTPGYLNDLWKFNPSDGTWTWEAGSDTANGASSYGTVGVPQPGSVPGGRDVAAAWVDSSGNFWLFGGHGLDVSNVAASPGDLADLWEFSPATGLWTWIDGPSRAADAGYYGTLGTPSFDNAPGSRQTAMPWVDAGGNFWLFGGLGLDSSGSYAFYLSDLWKYTP